MSHDIKSELIRRRMQELRYSLNDGAEDVARSIKAKTDWRHHVAQHPWLTTAISVAAGYALVPTRKTDAAVDQEALQELLKQKEVVLSPVPERSPSGSILSGLISVGLAAATRAAVSHFGAKYFTPEKSDHTNDTESAATHIPVQPK